MSDNRSQFAEESEALQRVAILAGIPALLAEFGVPLDSALAGLGLDATLIADPERRIPFVQGCRLLEACARLTGCPHFGLLLGARFDHRILGLAGAWMAHSPTLEAALTGFVALQPSASRGAVAYLHRLGEDVFFGYGIYDGGAVGNTQIYAAGIATGLNAIRALTAGAAIPEEIHFSFRAPADIAPYAAVFRAPVRFDQPQTGLVLARAALALPIPGARGADFDALQRRAAALMPPTERDWTNRVKRALRVMMLHSPVTTTAMAEALGVHARTLARHLAREGTGFQQVLDEVRFSTACELLALTDLPIGAIADTLSYASHGAFDGAFKRWAGTAPGQWRARAGT